MSQIPSYARSSKYQNQYAEVPPTSIRRFCLERPFELGTFGFFIRVVLTVYIVFAIELLVIAVLTLQTGGSSVIDKELRRHGEAALAVFLSPAAVVLVAAVELRRRELHLLSVVKGRELMVDDGSLYLSRLHEYRRPFSFRLGNQTKDAAKPYIVIRWREILAWELTLMRALRSSAVVSIHKIVLHDHRVIILKRTLFSGANDQEFIEIVKQHVQCRTFLA